MEKLESSELNGKDIILVLIIGFIYEYIVKNVITTAIQNEILSISLSIILFSILVFSWMKITETNIL